MAFDTELVAWVLTQSTITALIGTRIHPDFLPQNTTLDAIVYNQISGVRAHSTAGASGYCEARYQLSCWSATKAGAKALAEAVRKAIDGFGGTMGTTAVNYAFLEDETDAWEDEPKRWRTDLDFMIAFNESTT